MSQGRLEARRRGITESSASSDSDIGCSALVGPPFPRNPRCPVWVAGDFVISERLRWLLIADMMKQWNSHVMRLRQRCCDSPVMYLYRATPFVLRGQAFCAHGIAISPYTHLHGYSTTLSLRYNRYAQSRQYRQTQNTCSRTVCAIAFGAYASRQCFFVLCCVAFG